ncbi:hypothetical protein HDU93_002392 [Gonapodya sp. JEL0774]|nr:hypothetical protein HDU93_002392 [Gonapodya sp. JEL0774]
MPPIPGNGAIKHYDYLVIGGGSGGVASSRRAASYGAKVAIIEKARWGGTCVNVGCVPKKIMWNFNEILESVHDAAGYGLNLGTIDLKKQFSLRTLKEKRDAYIARLNGIYETNLEKQLVDRFKGTASFADSTGKRVRIAETGEELTADNILLAPGSKPVFPDVLGAELGVSSDGFFDLTEVPKKVRFSVMSTSILIVLIACHLVFSLDVKVGVVGGGYIGVELARVLLELGSEVTLFIRAADPLRNFDDIIYSTLHAEYNKRGLKIVNLARPKSLVDKGANGEKSLEVTYEQTVGTGSQTVVESGYNLWIWATGRNANIQGLGLDKIGVELKDDGFVKVDEWQNTTKPGVYAVGDVTGVAMLTPVAIAAGRKLSDRLFGGSSFAKSKLDYSNIPTVVFSHPPIGTVGLTEKEAVEKYGRENVKAYTSRFTNMYYAFSDVDKKAPSAFKLVVVGPEEKVKLVAHAHPIDRIVDVFRVLRYLNSFAVAIKMGATKEQVDSTVAIHPTASEEMGAAAQHFARMAPKTTGTAPLPSGRSRRSRAGTTSEASVGSTGTNVNLTVLADPHFDGYSLRNREILPETILAGGIENADDPSRGDPVSSVANTNADLEEEEEPGSGGSVINGRTTEIMITRRRTVTETTQTVKSARTPRGRISTVDSVSAPVTEMTLPSGRRATRSASAAIPSPAKPPPLRFAQKTPKRTRDEIDDIDDEEEGPPSDLVESSQSRTPHSFSTESSAEPNGGLDMPTVTRTPKRVRKGEDVAEDSLSIAKRRGRRQTVGTSVAESADSNAVVNATPVKRGRKALDVAGDSAVATDPTPKRGRRTATRKGGNSEETEQASLTEDDASVARRGSEESVGSERTMGTAATEVQNQESGAQNAALETNEEDVIMEEVSAVDTELEAESRETSKKTTGFGGSELLTEELPPSPPLQLQPEKNGTGSASVSKVAASTLTPAVGMIVGVTTVTTSTQTISVSTKESSSQTTVERTTNIGITVKPATSSAYAQADPPPSPDLTAPFIAEVESLQERLTYVQKDLDAANFEKAEALRALNAATAEKENVIVNAKTKDASLEQLRREYEQKHMELVVQKRAQEELGASMGSKLETERRKCEEERLKLEEDRRRISLEHGELRRRWLLVREVPKTKWDDIDWREDADLDDDERDGDEHSMDASAFPTAAVPPADGAASELADRLNAMTRTPGRKTPRKHVFRMTQEELKKLKPRDMNWRLQEGLPSETGNTVREINEDDWEDDSVLVDKRPVYPKPVDDTDEPEENSEDEEEEELEEEVGTKKQGCLVM